LSIVLSEGLFFVASEADRLPHIVVNFVTIGPRSVKLGFMTRRGAEDTIKRQAHTIKQRLENAGYAASEVAEPGSNEVFFWFTAEERPQPPTVRELLESYDDVILR
jgi:hypothetical protein